jgi:hypothetical protein
MKHEGAIFDRRGEHAEEEYGGMMFPVEGCSTPL